MLIDIRIFLCFLMLKFLVAFNELHFLGSYFFFSFTGKGGSKIRELQDETGATINVSLHTEIIIVEIRLHLNYKRHVGGPFNAEYACMYGLCSLFKAVR